VVGYFCVAAQIIVVSALSGPDTLGFFNKSFSSRFFLLNRYNVASSQVAAFLSVGRFDLNSGWKMWRANRVFQVSAADLVMSVGSL
jgi:hypothetical protein